MQQAFEAYQKNENYSDVRAVLSQALREAAHDGELDPSYAILYTMYADTARFEGNPSFALQLAEQGLDLIVRGEQPDEDARNALFVSRAYALADLGRYEEAVEAARITGLVDGPDDRQGAWRAARSRRQGLGGAGGRGRQGLQIAVGRRTGDRADEEGAAGSQRRRHRRRADAGVSGDRSPEYGIERRRDEICERAQPHHFRHRLRPRRAARQSLDLDSAAAST